MLVFNTKYKILLFLKKNNDKININKLNKNFSLNNKYLNIII